MCSVKVVLFAEVMGRSTGGLRPGGGSRGVCRRLFSDAPEGGKTDPGHFLRAMEAELRRRDTERWNFDFQKEKPLPGRYQWVAVGGKKVQEPQEVKIERTEREVEIVEEVVRQKKVLKSIPERRNSSGAGAATQAKITDFLRKRKRVEPEDESKNLKKLKVRRLSANLASSTNLASTATRPT